MTDSSERDDTILPKHYREAALQLWQQSHRRGMVSVIGENSMAPLIRVGDLVLVEPGNDNIRPGDVVTFRSDTGLITHRVISAREDETGLWFVVKGDNLLWADPAVPASKVVGRVLSVKRGQRQLDLSSKSWRALSRLIAIIMIVWIRIASTAKRVTRWDRRLLPRPLTALLSGTVRVGFNLLLRGLELLFCRWRP